jgi:predicted Fe-S protein YdhL (DUF1289 family)
VLDRTEDLCLGCGRSSGEIASWTGLDDAARQAIVDDLPRRFAAMKAARVARQNARLGRARRGDRARREDGQC